MNIEVSENRRFFRNRDIGKTMLIQRGGRDLETYFFIYFGKEKIGSYTNNTFTLTGKWNWTNGTQI